MAGPLRGGELAAVRPPRPPNSWILYRATRLKDLPPVGPGEPRRSQADVSSLIGKMWREETDQVRADFERLAEEAKAAHKLKYPNYRYQPKKKEEKEKEKEIQKQQKESKRMAKMGRGHQEPQPSIHPMYAGPSAGAPYYIPSRPTYSHLHYGPAGPSPPISLASTPSDSIGTPSVGHLPSVSPVPMVSALPVSSPLLTPEVSATSVSFPGIASPTATPEPQLPPIDAEPWKSTIPPADNQQASWANDNSVDVPYVAYPSINDMLNFNLDNDYLNLNLDYLNDFSNDVYLLRGDDMSAFLNQPQGEIEVSIGTHPIPQENPYYDYPVNGHTLNNAFAFDNDTLSNDHLPDIFNNAFAPPHYTLSQPISAEPSYALPKEFLEEINSQVAQPDLTTTTTTTTSTYTPPPGASHSSTRRVGANWSNSPFVREQLLGQSPRVSS